MIATVIVLTLLALLVATETTTEQPHETPQQEIISEPYNRP